MRNFPLAASLLLALSPLAFTTALAAQDAPAAEATAEAPAPVWPFEASDVPVDSGYTFGRLDNGMRYIIRQNATPAGTALVRMRIDSGALEEADSERGLSHYLEHMAFNGSTNIPEGQLLPMLERLGLAFGADTNATTTVDYTTYKLQLPRTDDATDARYGSTSASNPPRASRTVTRLTPKRAPISLSEMMLILADTSAISAKKRDCWPAVLLKTLPGLAP